MKNDASRKTIGQYKKEQDVARKNRKAQKGTRQSVKERERMTPNQKEQD